MDRHHRKDLSYCPGIRQRLKNGEVAKITIGCLEIQLRHDLAYLLFIELFPDECDQMPVDVIRQCALSQAGMAETEQPVDILP